MNCRATRTRCSLLASSLAVLIVAGLSDGARAADDANVIDMGDLKITAPDTWVRKEPKVSIIAHEFAIPKSKDDQRDGRFTVMPAGGSVDANIDRWAGQFAQPDGTATKPKVTKKEIAGHKVHLVDLSGTYKDQAGPFSPAVERPEYRMLAVVIESGDTNYFLKFYGPRHTVGENEAAFNKMVEGLKK